MMDSDKLLFCPDHIIVIGGGRWARVLVDVLCEIVPSSVKISICTSHNAESMSAWASSQRFKQNIEILQDWTDFDSEHSAAMIVVNAARDHEMAIERGLKAKIPVLVEKPITLTEKASQRMVDLAREQNVSFASAHIFLFARYLKNFKSVIPETEKIQLIRIYWMDPKVESRYGERKQYDAGLPIHKDWLPHVLSIAGALAPDLPQICKSLDFRNGGAHISLELMLGDVICNVEMVRNGAQRKRIVEVETNKQTYHLDFSKEPGYITHGTIKIVGDSEWETNKGPVALMLTSFLTWAAGGAHDERLSIDIGLRASHVIEQASTLYNDALNLYLIDNLSLPDEVDIDVDLRYALKEILSSEGPLDDEVFDRYVDRIRRHFSGARSTSWPEKKYDITKVYDVVKSTVQ